MINITSDNFSVERSERQITELEKTGQSYIRTYDRFEDYYEEVHRHLKSIDTSEALELRYYYLEYKQSRHLPNHKQLDALKKIVKYIHMNPQLVKRV